MNAQLKVRSTISKQISIGMAKLLQKHNGRKIYEQLSNILCLKDFQRLILPILQKRVNINTLDFDEKVVI
jgi:hypothetical protein